MNTTAATGALFVSHPPLTIDPAASLTMAAHKMQRAGVHHLLVTHEGQPLGIVSARQIFDRTVLRFEAEPAALALDPQLTVAEVMTVSVQEITETTSREQALAMLAECEALPVVIGGRAVGILTGRDLIRILAYGETEHEPLRQMAATGELWLGTPVVQGFLQMLADAGI